MKRSIANSASLSHKMRSAYGEPLPAEQVDALAAYLSRLVPDRKSS